MGLLSTLGPSPPPIPPLPEVLARRLRYARYGVLTLLALALISAYLTRHCLAVANTTMQSELGFNNKEFGYLYGAFSLGYLLCQIPGGWLGQRFGTRITLSVLSLLWSVMTIITATVASFSGLIVARFGYGLAQAGLIPNQAKVLSDWFSPEQRGLTSGVIILAMSVGGIAGLELTSRLMTVYNWHSIFLAYSLVGVCWSILFFLLFRSHPSEVSWLQENSVSPIVEQPVQTSQERKAADIPLLSMLNSPSVQGLFAQMVFKSAGYNFLLTFFPAYLEYAYKVPKDQTGSLASWSLLSIVIGSLIGGQIIDVLLKRTGNKQTSRCSVAFIFLFLTSVILACAPLASTGKQLAIIVAVSAFIMGIAQPCSWAAVIDIGGKNTAVVMGFLNMGASLPGILFSPQIGRLIDHIRATDGNWNLVIYLHAFFYFLSALCWIPVDPNKPLKTRGMLNAA